MEFIGEIPLRHLVLSTLAVRTAVNPNAIPKIDAPIEPITVKKPFVAHAHGTNADASSATMRKPVGNGMPRRIPTGANIVTTMMIRNGKDRPSADAKIEGDKTAVRRRTTRSDGIIQ